MFRTVIELGYIKVFLGLLLIDVMQGAIKELFFVVQFRKAADSLVHHLAGFGQLATIVFRAAYLANLGLDSQFHRSRGQGRAWILLYQQTVIQISIVEAFAIEINPSGPE